MELITLEQFKWSESHLRKKKLKQITLKKRDWSDSVVGKNVRLLKGGVDPPYIDYRVTI